MDTFKKIITVIATFLKVTVGLLLAVIGFILLFYILSKRMDLDDSLVYTKDALTPILVVLVGIIFILTIIVFVILIRRIFLVLLSHGRVFGDTLSVRLIGLGIVSVLFPQTIYWIISATVRFLNTLFFQIPTKLYSLWFVDKLSQDTEVKFSGLNDGFRWIIYMIQSLGVELANAIYSLSDRLPFGKIFIATCFWIFIGQIFSTSTTISPNLDRSNLDNNRLMMYYRNLSIATRRNISLSIIFILSVYLSITAIIAIPWMQPGKQPEILNRGTLEQKLNETFLTNDKFEELYPKNYKKDIDALSKLQIRQINADSLKNKGEPDEYINELENLIKKYDEIKNEIKSNRDNVIIQWNQQRDQILEWTQSNKKSVLTKYEAELSSPMSTQELSTFFQDLYSWYRSNLNMLYNHLETLKSYIDGEDINFIGWANKSRNDIERYAQKMKGQNFYYISNPYVYYSYYEVVDFPYLENLPEPPEPGKSWGPFGWISRWLLRTRSFEIALIVGMLGFGLFGAVISSFIREQFHSEPKVPFTRAMVSIIIRGFSAAIVIFLAVKGGLAIFTIGEQQPNAYVLFFTCLVGSVFSEEVWEWAHSKLSKSLSEEEITDPTSTSEKNQQGDSLNENEQS